MKLRSALLLVGGLLATSTLALGQTVSIFDVLVATETLTVVGTTTVSGSAFSVGRSTFVVSGGAVGIGTTAPAAALDVEGGNIQMPASSSTSGTLYEGSNTFLHNYYGGSGETANTFLGQNAGSFSITGNNNVGIGANALTLTTSGSDNLAAGIDAMADSVYGSHDIAIGESTLDPYEHSDPGENNIAIGENALSPDFWGEHSIGIGAETLQNIVSIESYYNIGVGDSALDGFSTGSSNIAIGHNAGSTVGGGDSQGMTISSWVRTRQAATGAATASQIPSRSAATHP